MYFRVPEEMRDPLLRQLREKRKWASILGFPILVIILSALGVAGILVEGHAILRFLEQFIPEGVSEVKLLACMIGSIVALATVVTLFAMRNMYHQCKYDEYLYCKDYDAVDCDENGSCPICAKPLANKAAFLFTMAKDEVKIIKRWGLEPSKEG
jgi:hypothetical protein